MGAFTILAVCVPVAILVCIWKTGQWIVRKIIDEIEWRQIKKKHLYKRKAWMM